MIIHKSIKVIGKVQGVFFRASTKEQADILGIMGTVKNENDGSVKIEAEGDEGVMEKFIEWCKKGPDRARVDRLEINEGSIKGFSSFSDFKILNLRT